MQEHRFNETGNEVLLIGAGDARGHALAWKFAESPMIDRVWVDQARPGVADEPKCEILGVTGNASLVAFANSRKNPLAFVCSEAPLAEGIVDLFTAANIPIFGPTMVGACLESSKIFAKEFMARNRIPTAPFESARNYEKAEQILRRRSGIGRFPVVVKANELARGKGVKICETLVEALDWASKWFPGSGVGSGVVIEDVLTGDEVSFTCFVDRDTFFLPLATARDHKQLYDDNTGPMTGGILTISPAPGFTDEMGERFIQEIVLPTRHGLMKEGIPFTGVITFGGMVTEDGPKLLEYNTRFGDPEAEVILRRFRGDLFRLVTALMRGNTIHPDDREWDPQHAFCTVLCAPGYPEAPRTGKLIWGIDSAKAVEGVKIFDAGTARMPGSNERIPAAGRVLAVTALGEVLEQAEERAKTAARRIHFEGGMHHRTKVNRGKLAAANVQP